MSIDKNNTEEIHWLVRPATIRKLWIGGYGILGLVVLADQFVTPHPYFGIDGSFGFNAWYGFAACTAMVVGAKGLSLFLKRPDNYYEGSGPDKGGDDV